MKFQVILRSVQKENGKVVDSTYELAYCLAEESPVEEANRLVDAICRVAAEDKKECTSITLLDNSEPVRGIDISGKVLDHYINILSEEIAKKKSISYMMVNGV